MNALPACRTVGGVYAIIRTDGTAPEFLESNPGGRFKGRDPSVSQEVLQGKWIDGCDVIYLGEGDDIRRRLKQYADFGAGKPTGHWGGRYIWQLADSDKLRVAWKASAPTEMAAVAETNLVRQFKNEHVGRLPFANIADPTARR